MYRDSKVRDYMKCQCARASCCEASGRRRRLCRDSQTDVGPVGVATLGKCKSFTASFYLLFCQNSRVCEPAYNSWPSPGSYKCESPHTTSFPPMSISVDDLVSSLSSSHIGEEATDLAILQAQLAQVLFEQSIVGANAQQVPQGYTQPSSTPTGRTPCSWGQDRQYWRPTDGDDSEDEQIVEDLLMPSSPGPTSQFSTLSQQHPPSAAYGYSTYSSTSSYNPEQAREASPSASIFTSTDPFYMAQVQASQTFTTSPQSVFSQGGRPAQSSPFMVKHHPQTQVYHAPPQFREVHGLTHSNSPALSLDANHVFAATAY